MGNHHTTKRNVSHPSIPIPIPKKNKVILLGTSDTGKSTLFYALKRLIPDSDSSGSGSSDTEQRQKELQLACSRVIKNIYEMMNQEERIKLENLIPYDQQQQQVVSLLHSIDEGVILESFNNCDEILSNLWKIPYFREFYESAWSTRDTFENVQELVARIDSKISFDPFSLIFRRTIGMDSYESMWKNTQFEIIDVGGRCTERNSWLYCFDSVKTVVYFVPLSQFNQVLREDLQTSRMVESLKLAKDLFKCSWFHNCKKVVLFTKPDVLVRKLQSGIEYRGTLNGNIRSELNVIPDTNTKLIINSIISEFFKALEVFETNFDSYHIINATSDKDVQSVCDIICGLERTTPLQKTTYISPCLLLLPNRLKFSLYNNCLKGNLVDIQLWFE